MKNKEYLHNMFNGTCTDDGNGDIETYESWLERQLLARIDRLEQLDLHDVVKSFYCNDNQFTKSDKCNKQCDTCLEMEKNKLQ